MAVVVVMAGCGPYGSSNLGQTCDAGAKTNHCASPTTYAACDGTDFKVWREYPCQDACGEGASCALDGAKAGTDCPLSWDRVQVCKAPSLAITCFEGKWSPRTCGECPDGGFCFACTCS